MAQSETSTMSSTFPYGGSNSGLTNRERERELARKRRAQQLKSEPDSYPLPLFPQPKKVQPLNGDSLQHSVQGVLGDFNDVAPDMYKKQYLLLGIGRVPQTPVEAGQKVFNFENKTDNKKENITSSSSLFSKLASGSHIKAEKGSSKIQQTSHQARTQLSSQEEKSKGPVSDLKNSALQHSKLSPTSKKHVVDANQQAKKSPTAKPSLQDFNLTLVKKEVVPAVNGAVEHSKEHGNCDLGVALSKEKLHRKEDKEGPSKAKPPKLSIAAGSSMVHVASCEDKSLCGERNSVEKILEEMTQPVAPPLTGIHTPLKGNSRFAFPHRTAAQKNSPSTSSSNVFNSKEKEEPSGLLHDLLLTDSDSEDEKGHHKLPSKPNKSRTRALSLSSSSGSSSDDSDSDSSDSDSDSSGNENEKSLVNSPNHGTATTSKITNGTRNWGLDHLQKAFTKGTKQPPTTANGSRSSPLSLNTVGGEGLRGNQVAPAPNASPLAKSSLNSDGNNALIGDKELPDPLFDAADCDHLFDSLPGLPEFSSGLPDNQTFSSSSNGFDCPPLDITDNLPPPEPSNEIKNSVHRNKSKADNSPKVLDKETTKNGLTSSLKHPKKGEKKESNSNKNNLDKEVKTPKEKKPKEKEKALKVTTKTKKVAECGKSKTAEKETVNSSSSSEKSGSKIKKTSSDKQSGEKKTVKPKNTSNKGSNVGATAPTKQASDGENEEVDVVTVSYDRPFLHRSNSSSSDHDSTLSKGKDSHKNSSTSKSSNQNKTKLSSKGMNGVKETSNGKLLSPLRSPKDGLTDGEITVDSQSRPDSLIVKIDLSLLKRIPRLPGTDTVVIKLKNTSSPSVETNGTWDSLSPPHGKIPKRHLSVELGDGKKIKAEPELTDKCSDRRDAPSSTWTEGRRGSTSSMGSVDQDENRRKRSPSREGDWQHGKRRRDDCESQRCERERDRNREKDREMNRDREFENGWDRNSDWDRMQDLHNGVGHINSKCSCDSRKQTEKKIVWIDRLYEPEPRVPHGPDYYLHEAKRIKHHADAIIKDNIARSHKYFEAVLNFVRCGKALEQNNDSESKSAYQMYLETIEMLKYAIRLSVSKSAQHPEKIGDKRFLALCMRLQSLLYMRLFKLRKDGLVKGSKILMEHFKGPPKGSQAPSPYNTSNPKITGTPSPMSPTPSPSGSIGSVGSVGSTGSNEAMTTPSRTSKLPSGTMTSPVNATIPQKVHTMMVQHLGFTSHILYAYDVWEQSQTIFIEFKDFFIELDRTYGPVTLHSPMMHVIEYVEQGYRCLKESAQGQDVDSDK